MVKGSGTKKHSARKKPHEEFADQLVAMLEKGVAPWQKSWKAGEYYSPFNPASGTIYRGINRLMLSDFDMADPRWMTFRQAGEKGYRVKSGSKARPVEYWQWTEEVDRKDDDGNIIYGPDGKQEKETVELDRPRIYYFSVFHASQLETEDREPIPAYEPPPLEWNPHEKAEAILNSSGASITHDQRDKAYYSPMRDEIHLPYRENFSTAGDYYNTALHELGHWACSKRRLDMEGGVFGTESYAKEELKVEIASWMICQDLGLDFAPENSAAYIAHWVSFIKEDPYEIVRACRDAEKIKNYVLDLERGLNHSDPFIFTDLTSSATETVVAAQSTSTPGVNEPDGLKRQSAEALGQVIIDSADMAANAPDHSALVQALQLTHKNCTELAKEPSFESPAVLAEAAIINRMLYNIGSSMDDPEKLPAPNIIEDMANRLIIMGNVQARRIGDTERQTFFESKITDYYRNIYPSDDMKEADMVADFMTGRVVKFRPDHAPDREWSIDYDSILCRKNADEAWAMPTNDEEAAVYRDISLRWMFNPVINLDRNHFLTYDGKTHTVGQRLSPDVVANNRELDLVRATNSVNRIMKTIISPSFMSFPKRGAVDIFSVLSETKDPNMTLEPKFKDFFDSVDKIIRQDSEQLHLSERDMAFEATLGNKVLQIISASRQLGLPDLPFSYRPDSGPTLNQYQAVGLRSARPSDKHPGLLLNGIPVTHLSLVGRGEKPIAFAIVDSCTKEVLSSFVHADNARAFVGAINGETIELMPTRYLNQTFADQKIFLNVPYSEKNQAKANGATWDKEAKSWCARPGANLNMLAKWLPQDQELSLAADLPATSLELATEPVYLNVPFMEKNQAKTAGARWDAKAKLWMAPVGADLAKLAQWIPEKEPVSEPVASPEVEFADVLQGLGFKLNGFPIMDGAIHRVPVIDGKSGAKDGAYMATPMAFPTVGPSITKPVNNSNGWPMTTLLPMSKKPPFKPKQPNSGTNARKKLKSVMRTPVAGFSISWLTIIVFELPLTTLI